MDCDHLPEWGCDGSSTRGDGNRALKSRHHRISSRFTCDGRLWGSHADPGGQRHDWTAFSAASVVGDGSDPIRKLYAQFAQLSAAIARLAQVRTFSWLKTKWSRTATCSCSSCSKKLLINSRLKLITASFLCTFVRLDLLLSDAN